MTLLYRGRQYVAFPYDPRPPLPKKVERAAKEALAWLGDQQGALDQLWTHADNTLKQKEKNP